MMPTSTPVTDAIDAANAPDTNGNKDWKQAYFAMMKHANTLERRNVRLREALQLVMRYPDIRVYIGSHVADLSGNALEEGE